MDTLERIVLWLHHTTSSQVVQLDEARELANDAVEEITDLRQRLAAAEAEVERLRPLVQCCERDHDLDGSCHVHPQGLRGEIERVQSESRILRESLSAVEPERDALRTTLHGVHELLAVVIDDLADAAKGGRNGTA